METPSHLQIILRNRRRIFPIRRANVRNEIWIVDVRRIPGKRENPILTLDRATKIRENRAASAFFCCSTRLSSIFNVGGICIITGRWHSQF